MVWLFFAVISYFLFVWLKLAANFLYSLYHVIIFKRWWVGYHSLLWGQIVVLFLLLYLFSFLMFMCVVFFDTICILLLFFVWWKQRGFWGIVMGWMGHDWMRVGWYLFWVMGWLAGDGIRFPNLSGGQQWYPTVLYTSSMVFLICFILFT